MSNIVSEWAEEAPVANTYERILLMKLARHADNDGTGTYPAIDTMARTALCDRSTVKRKLRALVRRGLIAQGDQNRAAHIRRDRRPTVYDVLVPRNWYGDSWDKLMRERVAKGYEPIDPATRPDIAPPDQIGRATRSDKGVPNPLRSPKKTSDTGVQHRGARHGGARESRVGGSGGSSYGGAGASDALETGLFGGVPAWASDQGISTGGLSDPSHGGSLSPSTGGLTVPHGGSLRPPNPSLNPSGESNTSPSGPPPRDGAPVEEIPDRRAEEESQNSATDSDPEPSHGSAGSRGGAPAGGHWTPANESMGEVLARFWAAVPSEIRPGSPKTRQALSSEIWPLFQEPCTWGFIEGGPELLADWFSRQIPRQPIKSLPGWFRYQLEHRAPEGPVDDALVPIEECVCDENGMVTEIDEHGTERASRCPNRHLRSQDSASALVPDPEIQRQITQSLASAPGIEQTPGTDELGASRLGDLSRQAPEHDQVLPNGDVLPKF